MTLLDSIIKLLRCRRFTYNNEKGLQDSIAVVLQESGVQFVREFSISRSDRPDFLVPRLEEFGGGVITSIGGGCVVCRPNSLVAIEVKIKGSRSDLLRQIHRYAQHESIAGIIVVSSRACHRGLPGQINSKPVVLVSLMENAF